MTVYNVVLVGLDPRCEPADAVREIASITRVDGRLLNHHLQAGTPLFVGRQLDRASAKVLLDAIRAAGGRAKPWDPAVPLHVADAPAAQVVLPRTSSRPPAKRPSMVGDSLDSPFSSGTRERISGLTTKLDTPLSLPPPRRASASSES